MILTRSEIERLIPHAGTMCLIDGVLSWDKASIRCFSTRHRAADNPLRHAGRLGILCGIEFAAQAMAIHGGLCSTEGDRPRVGYLGSLREIVCHSDRLEGLEGDLLIECGRLMGDADHVIYTFTLAGAARTLMAGRAAVVLRPVSP